MRSKAADSKLKKDNRLGDERIGVFFDPPDEIEACLTCHLPSCYEKSPECRLSFIKKVKQELTKSTERA